MVPHGSDERTREIYLYWGDSKNGNLHDAQVLRGRICDGTETELGISSKDNHPPGGVTPVSTAANSEQEFESARLIACFLPCSLVPVAQFTGYSWPRMVHERLVCSERLARVGFGTELQRIRTGCCIVSSCPRICYSIFE